VGRARHGWLVAAAIGIGCPQPRETEPPRPEPVLALDHGSGTVLLGSNADGDRIAMVADASRDRIVAIELASGEAVRDVAIAGEPIALASGPAGLWVALREAGAIVELRGDELGRRIAVPAEPTALAWADDRTLLVVSSWGAAITAIDVAEGVTRWRIDVARDPRAIVLGEDGRTAFVSHGTASVLTAVELATHRATTIALAGTELRSDTNAVRTRAREGAVVAPRVGSHGFALARGRGRVFVPLVLTDPGDGERPSAGYGPFGALASEVPTVAVVDERAHRPIASSLVAAEPLRPGFVAVDPLAPCLLPSAAAYVPARDSLIYACLGSDVLVEVDAASAEPSSAERQRIAVAEGPTAIAVEDTQVVIFSDAAAALTIVALDDGEQRTLALPSIAPEDPQLVAGRRLFHTVGDRRIAEDGRACASCHPGGRDDGLTWSTPLGPRQTPLLAGRVAGMTRLGWSGESARIEEHLVATFSRLRGKGLAREEVAQLVAYVHSIAPPPHDDRDRDGGFAALGCAGCHAGTLRSDARVHDVGSRGAADVTDAFRTPPLRGLHGTAPYFHDGRFASLRELVLAGHGTRTQPSDVDALVDFLEAQ
jgi:hypothetical protein